jgi:hypothetical protein
MVLALLLPCLVALLAKVSALLSGNLEFVSVEE